MYTIINQKLINQGTDSNEKFFGFLLTHIKCDTVTDLPEPLPNWSAGSRCDVLENGGSAYELSLSGQWMKINSVNSGGSIEVDAALSEESINPVENRVVTEKFNELETVIGNINTVLEEVV